jgi:hypothetical protein
MLWGHRLEAEGSNQSPHPSCDFLRRPGPAPFKGALAHGGEPGTIVQQR